MQLDRISAVVRPRSQWEAIDLGMVMARAWWWPLYRAWLAVTLPAFVLLHLLLFTYPWAAVLVFWWLKPLWERSLLHILSHALFGEMPPLRETLRAFPKLVAKQWFASLTYRRFSLSRSMDLPVVQLENLQGKQRSQRLQLLHGKRGSGAGWLTVIGIHIESVLPFAFLALLFMLLPNEVQIGWTDLLTTEVIEIELLFNLLSYVVISLVAPFYVAAGFSLYLNRRTWLEGWDIELVFRRLLKRVQQNGLAKVAALLVAVLLFSWQPNPLMAQAVEFDRVAAKAAIEKIMAGDEFHDTETVPRLDWKWQSEDESKQIDLPNWLLQLIEFLAINLRAILWAVVITLLLLFLFKYRHWLARFGWRMQHRRAPDEPLPTVLFGMEVGSETLPQDVPAEVNALWQQQQHRAAYALLYRATLNRLMENYQIRFYGGHTEDECRLLVQSHTAPELGAYFSELTEHWQRLAYAHQLPADTAMMSLCQRWLQFFEQVQHNG